MCNNALFTRFSQSYTRTYPQKQTNFMPFLAEFSIAFSALALIISMLAAQKASDKFQSSKVVKKVRDLDAEVTALADEIEKTHSLVRRKIARDNMAKAREKRHSNGNDGMTDEEWRAYATKRIQQGLPVE